MSTRVSAQPGLHLFTSNRLEALAERLAARLRTPLASPLAGEIVVVRNKGMERWLRLELARRLGVCAHHQFEFPEEFIRRLFHRVLPDTPADSPLERDILAWRIAQVLPELKQQPEFEAARHYLGNDDRKLLQLSGRLAHLLDQYLVFRPEIVLGWDVAKESRDPTAAWQGALWRAVSHDASERHPAALARRFTEALDRPDLVGLPERVTVFGVSALPPFHLDMLAALARRVQVNFFLLQPSQEYWGDITSPREEERIRRRTLGPNEAAFDLHLESGNRLLASLGYLGRDFLKLLLGAGDWMAEEAFADPGEDSLLHCIQSDLLHLRDRGLEGSGHPGRSIASAESPAEAGSDEPAARMAAPLTPIAPTDDSLQIHSCHSPLREMEVLQDHILDWLQRDPALTPRDIVVMMPDVETYAPFVQAVFGSPEDEAKRIPYSLADRGTRRASHVVDTFLQLLALPATRLGAATVLAPLDTDAVRRRFGFAEADTETLRDWIRAVNIRWGIDSAHRASLGLPALDANAWRPGLDRLLLGYAMASNGERLFGNMLPFDDIEGDAAALAGRLAEYVERVFNLVASLQETRPLAGWADLLEGVLGDFFTPSEEAERDLQLLRGALANLRAHGALAGFSRGIGLGGLLERLEPALGEDLQHGGFITGGVTFCGLKPMRSIPFKMVCLVGMNDGAFPRPTPHLSFDLMARAPRLGDRSTREDDRYLFLETLLSARQRLYLSFVGQSIRDNREAPPSVLLSELLDYVDQGFTLGSAEPVAPPAQTILKPAPSASPAGRKKRKSARPADDEHQLAFALLFAEDPGAVAPPLSGPGPVAPTLREHLVTRHHLQAFHADYFNCRDARLFSYSAGNSRASRTATRERLSLPAFLELPLVELDAAARAVSLEDLAQFLANPAKAFLRRRLNIFLPETAEELPEREPFVLNALAQFQLKQQLISQASATAHAVAAADGSLPLGAVGQADFARAEARARLFAARLASIRLPPPPAPTDLGLTLGPFTVSGRVAEFTAAGPLYFRCARLKARDLLRAWLHHLAANCARPGQTTTLLNEDSRSVLAPPADPAAALGALLELYWQGLRAPLKFFPESALAFAAAERAARLATTRARRAPAIEKARDFWEGDRFRDIEGEQSDPAFDCCFRREDPLDAVFEQNARAVFGPLLEHEERTEE